MGSNDTVLDGVTDPQKKVRFGGRTPSPNIQLQIAAAIWRLQTSISDFAFCHITLVLVGRGCRAVCLSTGSDS